MGKSKRDNFFRDKFSDKKRRLENKKNLQENLKYKKKIDPADSLEEYPEDEDEENSVS